MTTTDEDLLRKFSKLLSDEKNKGLTNLEEDCVIPNRKLSLYLVGKLVTDQNFSSFGLKTALTKAWNLEGALEFSEAGRNLFLLVFELEIDKWKVWMGSPWSFNRDLFVLGPLHPNLPPDHWNLTHVELWVQFHGIPLEYMLQKTALALAGRIGNLVISDAEDVVKWARFICSRIYVDITKPLVVILSVSLLNGTTQEILIKYERLPRHCVFDGHIGHEYLDYMHRGGFGSEGEKRVSTSHEGAAVGLA
ncbi:uncharacterized protein [Typha latifolia]|uniref:uncharacterized protein n=1 Tax=Typha latifolia TaxID=4733 RepID=UPI003C2D62AA